MLGDVLDFCERHCVHVQSHKHGTTTGAARDPQLCNLRDVVALLVQLVLTSNVSHRLHKRDRDRRPPGTPSRDGPGSAGIYVCTILQHPKVKVRRDSQNARALQSAGAEWEARAQASLTLVQTPF